MPPIGALAERVAATGAGWVMTEAEWRDEARMLERIEAILAPSNADELARRARAAAAMPRVTLGAMAAATLAIYARAMAGRRAHATRPAVAPAHSRRARLPALECRLRPPTLPRAGRRCAAVAASRLAQAALRLRQSSAGPLLRALTPGFVREALKARLK